MKKQMLKGFTMLMLVVALAFITAVASANGQSRNVRAAIPFEFAVGNEMLPAGEYTVTSATAENEALMIRSVDAKNAALRLTSHVEDKRNEGQVKLVFHRYGERYFLAQVWTGENGRELAKSRQERAIEKEISKIASLRGPAQPAYETVEIVAMVR